MYARCRNYVAEPTVRARVSLALVVACAVIVRPRHEKMVWTSLLFLKENKRKWEFQGETGRSWEKLGVAS